MRDRAINGRQDQHFVTRQVELDPWQVARRRRNRPAIGDSPLARRAVATVPEDLELYFVGRKLDAGLLVDPGGNFPKCADQEIDVEMRFIGQREIEILGETVRLEVALLETGSAFEYPLPAERRVIEDAGKEPAENVVLFYDVRQKPRLTAVASSSRRSITLCPRLPVPGNPQPPRLDQAATRQCGIEFRVALRQR